MSDPARLAWSGPCASRVKTSAGTSPKTTLEITVSPAVHRITTLSMAMSGSTRQVHWPKPVQHADAQPRQQEPAGAAEDCNDQVFSEELAHQA